MQIAFVTYPGLTALDVVGPYEVLRMLPGAQIRFVWHQPGPITTDSGVLVLGATHSLVATPRPDIVLVPGSITNTAGAARDLDLLAWLRHADNTSQWTTSVCGGSVILGAAGLLAGKRATSHWSAVKALRTFGATPEPNERIVRDGKLVSCAGVSAGVDLALWLVGEIAGPEHAEAVQLAIEYDPQPPYDSGHASKATRGTKKRATALVARDLANPAQLGAVAGLAWDVALGRIKRRARP